MGVCNGKSVSGEEGFCAYGWNGKSVLGEEGSWAYGWNGKSVSGEGSRGRM